MWKLLGVCVEAGESLDLICSEIGLEKGGLGLPEAWWFFGGKSSVQNNVAA